MDNQKIVAFLNEVYKPLCDKSLKMIATFFQKNYECNLAFYNGHYNKNAIGNWQIEYFPIPVLSIKNLCDIEFNLDKISISTKMIRETALKYDYSIINEHQFEIYGVKDYLHDFYNNSMLLGQIKDNIENSSEQEIGFSFTFSYIVDAADLIKFIEFLRKENFYY